MAFGQGRQERGKLLFGRAPCSVVRSGYGRSPRDDRRVQGRGGDRSVTTLIAWRNIVHDPVRFFATLIGIVFAIVLFAVQMGMLIGFANTTTGLIRHSRADIWIVPSDTSNVDQADILRQRAYFQAIGTAVFAAASRYIVRFVIWRRPHGGSQLVIIVGFDPTSALAPPWNIVEGSITALQLPHSVMIDRLYARSLALKGGRSCRDQQQTRCRCRLHRRRSDLHTGTICVHDLRQCSSLYRPR